MSERSWKESIALILIVFIAGLMIAGTHSQERTAQLTATTGDKSVQIRAEADTHNLIVTNFPANMVHRGDMFYIWGGYFLDENDSVETLFETAPVPYHTHITGKLRMSKEVTVQIYEDTTKTHDPTKYVTAYNRNRYSSRTSQAVISRTPLGTGDGNLIWSIHTHFGEGTLGDISGGAGFIWKPSTKYLVRFTSNVKDNLLASEVSWFESIPLTEIPGTP